MWVSRCCKKLDARQKKEGKSTRAARYLAGSDCYHRTLNTHTHTHRTKAPSETSASRAVWFDPIREWESWRVPTKGRQTWNSPKIESASSPSRDVTSCTAALSATQYSRQIIHTRIALEVRERKRKKKSSFAVDFFKKIYALSEGVKSVAPPLLPPPVRVQFCQVSGIADIWATLNCQRLK